MPDHTRPGPDLEQTIAEGQDAVRRALRVPSWRHAGAQLDASTRQQLELLHACRKTLEALAQLVRDPNPHLRSPLVPRVTTALQAADALQDWLGREIEQLQQVTP